MISKLTTKKLRDLIKESVREVIEAELMKLRAFALPDVSEKEQKDIEKRHGRPSRKRAKSYPLSI